MTQFAQSEACRVDPKGRLLFPVFYRKQLGDALSEGFCIKKSIYTKSLELHTKASWEKQLLKLQQLNLYKRDHQEVLRHFLYGAREVELDSAGRILIPKEMLNYAEITNDVIISPLLKCLELWNPENFKQYIESTSNSFPDKVDKVMGELGLDKD